MKARWKILIAAGNLLVLLAASMMMSVHFQPENEVEAYKKLLRAKGEKLEISEVRARAAGSGGEQQRGSLVERSGVQNALFGASSDRLWTAISCRTQ